MGRFGERGHGERRPGSATRDGEQALAVGTRAPHPPENPAVAVDLDGAPETPEHPPAQRIPGGEGYQHQRRRQQRGITGGPVFLLVRQHQTELRLGESQNPLGEDDPAPDDAGHGRAEIPGDGDLHVQNPGDGPTPEIPRPAAPAPSPDRPPRRRRKAPRAPGGRYPPNGCPAHPHPRRAPEAPPPRRVGQRRPWKAPWPAPTSSLTGAREGGRGPPPRRSGWAGRSREGRARRARRPPRPRGTRAAGTSSRPRS